MNPFDGEGTVRQVSPREWGARIDMDKGTWDHPTRGPIPRPDPPASDWVYILHYGGGPTSAGTDDPHQELSRPERVALRFSTVARVLRAYESYHLGKGWRGVAYNAALPKWLPRLFRLRGWSHNGAQMGSGWNSRSLAFVFPIGGGQRPGRRARRTFARVWLEYPPPGRRELPGVGPRGVLGHKHTGYPTACPGPRVGPWVVEEGWIGDLGVMKRTRRGWATRGGKVKALTKRLRDLGYLDEVVRVYSSGVEAAVEAFQTDKRITVDGKVGPQTLRALAETVEES